jgi:hypothetical protein
MPAFLFSPLGRASLIAAVVLAATYAIYLRGRDDAALRSQQRAAEAMESRNATDRNVDRLPDGGAAAELLRQWSRQPE